MREADDITQAWRTLGRRLADLRKAAGYTQHQFASLVLYGRSSVANVETGHQQPNRAFWNRCDEALGTRGALTQDYDRIIALVRQRRRHRIASDRDRSPHSTSGRLSLDNAEPTVDEYILRSRVERSLNQSDVAVACLDDWEATVTAHAQATRYRPAYDLLSDLLADIDDLQLIRGRRHTTATLRRTTILTAQMAGLISLTLLKLNDFDASRRWGRTARTAAADAADPTTSSWVWAQEAYRSFYAGDLTAAINVAERAQELAGPAASVGGVLAAAIEGRAHAAAGDAIQARHAMQQAEVHLEHLPADATVASAFGYDEAQFRFHSGNAYTHLRDTATAWSAQQRALQLYPPSDYLDRALIGLDRAACLICDGDINEGAAHLTSVVSGLAAVQRDALVLTRAARILATVPATRARVPAMRDAAELLAVCAMPTEEAACD